MKITQNIKLESEIKLREFKNFDDEFIIYFDIKGGGLYYDNKIFDIIGITDKEFYGSEETRKKEYEDWSKNYLNKIGELYLGKENCYTGLIEFDTYYSLSDIDLSFVEEIKEYIKKSLEN